MIESTLGTAGRRRVLFLVIALLAILTGLTSITNGFALDDVHIIFENHRVHALTGWWQLFGQTYWPPEEGAALYRPLTMLAFALQWVTGGGSPLVFHVVNVALYAVVAVALYRLAVLIVPAPAALIGAALFAVHPVHIEAVANIVGQEELWVAAIVLLATTRYIRLRNEGALPLKDVLLLGVSYLAACMFKEHAIVFPLLIVAAELTIIDRKVSSMQKLRALIPTLGALAVAGAAFVAMRSMVIGQVATGGSNVLLLGAPYSTRLFTMLRVFMEWVRLLVWPASLSADYSSHRVDAATSFDASMVPGLLVVFAVVAIAWSLRKTQPAVTFGFLWAGVTLLIPSNLILVTGFVLAERTLFLASAGLSICAGVGAVHLWRSMSERGRVQQLATGTAFAAVLAVGVIRSATRNVAWHDNERLFRQTVLDVPTSYRAHWMLAEFLTDAGHTQEGLDEMLIAVVLGRKNDPGLLSFAADRFRMANQCPRAMGMYRKALEIDPTLPDLRFNASVCLLQLGKLDEAKSLAREGLVAAAEDSHLQRVLVVADSLANVSKKQNPTG
ncbi:MAG TPA: tetratricopeptide repeat protein [Gemmatimonadaceae bacterium]|nr:tetratricopeptide repeat protein [Gemmatimonadaceae bacterium]